MSVRIVPVDANGYPIQTLALGSSTNVISVSGTTARAAIPSGAGAEDIIRIACTTDCHIKFGDSSVEATTSDPLFTTGVEAFKVPDQATHVAAIQVSASGTMTLTEMI